MKWGRPTKEQVLGGVCVYQSRVALSSFEQGSCEAPIKHLGRVG